MKTLQRFGGLAALYLAVAYLVGLMLFIVVLDYVNIADAAQKVALIVEKQMVFFATNLLLYVFFGIFLVILALALHDRLKPGAPALSQMVWYAGVGIVLLRHSPVAVDAGRKTENVVVTVA